MISHVLDTDILSLFQHGHAGVSARCAAMAPGTLAITIISVEEQFLGWYTRARRAKLDDEIAMAYERMTAFASFIRLLPITTFSAGAIQTYRRLKSQKLNISKKDLCIAAIALDMNATVVTANVSNFGRVPGLHIDDWTE